MLENFSEDFLQSQFPNAFLMENLKQVDNGFMNCSHLSRPRLVLILNYLVTVITACQRSCRKVMFSQMPVCQYL